MQSHPELTRERIRCFADDLRERCYPARTPLGLEVYSAPDRIGWEEAMRGAYRPATVGEAFGPAWSTHWFKVTARVPADWAGREVHLLWNSNSEACVWERGQPLQGLTGVEAGGGRPLRPECPVIRKARGGETVSLAIEMACNILFGQRGGVAIGRLDQAEIACFDRAAWDLHWDLVVIHDMAAHLPESEPRRGQALWTGNAIVNACRLDNPATWPEGRRLAAAFLGCRNGPSQHVVSAVGHAHLDTAWLWPLAETHRKCVRTFSTALRLIEEYPDYIFTAAQAQQYAWMKEEHPALYARIRKAAAAGRFVPTGGTWVEPDCNLPSGESLVRQFLYGQRFFEQEFGTRCVEFWNPDVFGYNAQLPQIMRGAGIRYFLTQKLSWNQFNKPRHHTFLWEGLDGSRVLTHFPPADTYNATPDVRTLQFNVRNFGDADRARESYLLFGHGDGGGGPTRAMLEQAHRLADCEGVSRLEPRAPAAFFARCEADVKAPAVWRGEMYLELHRGTYTTQARTKQGNRRGEGALRAVEFLGAAAHALGCGAYPAEDLGRLWRLLLLNQFHDILPGSSIREVYEETEAQYDSLLRELETHRAALTAALLGGGARARGWAAVNTTGHARAEVGVLPGDGVETPQRDADGRSLVLASAPAWGWGPVDPGARPEGPARIRRRGGGVELENEHLRARIDRDGRLVSLWDKARGAERVPAGAAGNRLILFEDRPNRWDAWDVDAHHLEKPLGEAEAVSFRVIERGPLRAGVEVTYRLSPHSRLSQRILLAAGSRHLEFACTADWHESRVALKVEFPWAVRHETAAFEQAFGLVRRPTHFNTLRDLAQFEVCAHTWADLSEPGAGVALLNDAKYGHAVHGSTMRLTLLRAPKSPDAEADMGRHTFRYAVLPHGGDPMAADLAAAGRAFNEPLRFARARARTPERALFTASPTALVLDTIKRAEDSGALILRLYEAYGSRGEARLTSSLPVARAVRCNLLEDEDAPVRWDRDGARIPFRPFEIITLKLDLGKPR